MDQGEEYTDVRTADDDILLNPTMTSQTFKGTEDLEAEFFGQKSGRDSQKPGTQGENNELLVSVSCNDTI